MYDLLIKSGKVVDPGQELQGVMDVAVDKGRIVRIDSDVDPQSATRVLDVGGRLVVPGLIDLHTHVFWGIATPGVTSPHLHPDVPGVMSGVTTVVDTGSSGSHNFGVMLNTTIPSARTRVIPFLHICRTGETVRPDGGDRQSIELEATISTVERFSPLIRGIKMRFVTPSIGNMGIELARLAITAARETRTRVMVHIGDSDGPSNEEFRALTLEMVDMLGSGDIITHVYTPYPGGMLDSGGKVVPQLLAAKERGVVLDSGDGGGNFGIDAAWNLIGQGVLADAISTDMNSGCRNDVVYSLTEVMSRAMALGFGLEEVIRKTTVDPARALGLENEIGVLAVGREADMSVLDLVDGNWEFTDRRGVVAHGQWALAPAVTVKSGEVIAPDWGPHPWGWLPKSTAY